MNKGDGEMENMFGLFTPMCLCGSALTSMWAGREAEYAKQLEQRLITLQLLCKKDGRFSLTFAEAKQTGFLLLKEEYSLCYTVIGESLSNQGERFSISVAS